MRKAGASANNACRDLTGLKGCNPDHATLPDKLATFLGTRRDYQRNEHLIPMVRAGQLRLRYPETAKHPHQAYVADVAEQEDRDD